MRFRNSFLRAFMACPLQAKFHYLDRLPERQGSKAAFGTVIHAALQQYNLTGDEDEAIEVFKRLWSSPEEAGVDIEVWNKYTTFGGLRQRGIEIVREYHAKQRWEQRQVVAVEHHFLVPFGRHELEGTIDLLELKKNHRSKELLRIVDFKTNAKAPNYAELALNTQFTTYIWATLQPEFWLGNGPDFPPVRNGEWWMEMTEGAPRRGIWYQLWGNKEMDAGGREDIDFGRLQRVCDEVERAIELGVFVPDISGETCALCDFANGPCPVEIPSRAELEEHRLNEEETSWV